MIDLIKINKMVFLSIVILLLSTPWILELLKRSLLLSILSLVLLICLVIIFNKSSAKLYLTTGLVFLVFTITVFVVSFDKTIFSLTDLQLMEINARRSYYPQGVGRIFHNKISVIFYGYEKNVFFGLDPNLYFFASHPRERAGADDFQRYYPWLLPFLVVGIFEFAKKKPTVFFSIVIVTSLMNGFINYKSTFNSLLFFPLISAFIIIGLNTSISYVRKHLK